MRIGVVVDGRAELVTFPGLLSRVLAHSPHSVVRVVVAPVTGDREPGQVAKECESRIRILRGLGADRILVVLDRESARLCSGATASRLRTAIARVSPLPVDVVLKSTMFENWLVADIDSIAAQPARFRVLDHHRRAVAPDHADSIDALALLKQMAQRKPYDKVTDGTEILRRADVLAIARNSRSFRRLLRVLEHPAYATQSARPVLR